MFGINGIVASHIARTATKSFFFAP